MADVAPHLAFPLRVRAGRFLTVEQDSRRHREDQADVVLRTRPGTFDHAPDLGLRELVGSLEPVSPDILAAVTNAVDGDFDASADLATRTRNVAVAIREEDAEAE